MTASSHSRSGDSAVGKPNHKHIVDVLIEERAEKLLRSPLWPVLRPVLYKILQHGPAVRMADAVADYSATGVFDYVSALLHVDLEVSGLENIPETGRVLIASTHPTGIPDGVAMFDALKRRRPDMTFFANRDALRAAPGLDEMIIPVEWVEDKRTRLRSRETLIATKKAFQAEKCVVLFPSGRLAFMDDEKKLTEQPWLGSVAAFARKYDSPVVPTQIECRKYVFYYWFWKIKTEFRDKTLLHELLKKKWAPYKITFGPPIEAEALTGDSNEVAQALRQHAVSGVLAGKEWRAIAPPKLATENRR